jgi:hypothetical protein
MLNPTTKRCTMNSRNSLTSYKMVYTRRDAYHIPLFYNFQAMKEQFNTYLKMMSVLTDSFPEIRLTLRDTWSKVTDPEKLPSTEYYHRIIDGNNRRMVDVKYHSMKEIVENVYYNIIPDDKIEHYLVKKKDSVENVIRLKCRGIIPNENGKTERVLP